MQADILFLSSALAFHATIDQVTQRKAARYRLSMVLIGPLN